MSAGTDPVLSVSDFVAVLNQSLEYAYPSVSIVGELANFRISKNRWVYFDLKDENSSVRFFGTVYALPGPLEDGMVLQVRGNPRLHALYGFSVNVMTIQPVGEGSLKKAAALLEAKLRAEGLFEADRKRPLPYPPRHIALITSGESAAYADFIKIINERWSGLTIDHIDVQVQGEQAPAQLVRAIEYCNAQALPPEVLIMTRGGGSAEDLGAFSTEQVTRAIAASRVPTLVAIGHETDLSLAELAADQRASTPSNAAQFLVPDKQHELQRLAVSRVQLGQLLSGQVDRSRQQVELFAARLQEVITRQLQQAQHQLELQKQLLTALSPQRILQQGYALVVSEGKTIRSAQGLRQGQEVIITMYDGSAPATVDQAPKIHGTKQN